MGQTITVEATRIGDVVIYGADRSLSGQDGAGFASLDAALASEGFPAALAGRIFERDSAVANVFVASNQVVVKRKGEWTDAAVTDVADIITTFFRYYDDSGAQT